MKIQLTNVLRVIGAVVFVLAFSANSFPQVRIQERIAIDPKPPRIKAEVVSTAPGPDLPLFIAGETSFRVPFLATNVPGVVVNMSVNVSVGSIPIASGYEIKISGLVLDKK
ncbi:MAG TPA: hypothetical protein VI704_01235, partial [Bacteroidota bacterium]|nr:hypothetical protein [Bacteroidota bacterium]